MKRNLLVLCPIFLLLSMAVADQTAGKAIVVTETGKESFEANLPWRTARMHVRCGECGDQWLTKTKFG